jgi:hypothetical protein
LALMSSRVYNLTRNISNYYWPTELACVSAKWLASINTKVTPPSVTNQECS